MIKACLGNLFRGYMVQRWDLSELEKINQWENFVINEKLRNILISIKRSPCKFN